MIDTLLNASLNGLMLSSMYILIALGFTLLLSIMGILNFAHGAIYMVGGYLCYQFAVEWGFNSWVSLILSLVVVSAFGLFLEKYCFRPFYGDMYRTIVMTIAIILFLQTTVNVLVGVYIRQIPPFVPGVLKAGAVSINIGRLITFIIGGILLLMMFLFINKSKLGQQMLAISMDMEGAELQGINVNRVSAIACAIGCGLAAVAGSLMGAIFQLSPFMGDLMLVKAIQIVILSGIGSIGGILAGGLIIGLIDGILPLFVSGAATSTVSICIIMGLLLLRPRGLFGREVT